DDLLLGQALGGAPGDVGTGLRVGAHAGDDDAPQGVVGLAVAAAVEPVTGDPAGGGGDRGHGAQVRPGGLGPQPGGVVTGGDQEHGGGVRADAVEAEQSRGAGGNQRDDQLVKPAELGIEELGAAAELAQGQQRVVADCAARAGPQRGQAGDQAGRAVPGEPGPDVIGAGQDQRPGLA